ncbi:MAG: molecular chaperone HtpG [Ruminococcaceae bacterium]|nr:molecular chaperone HtpG [Oscillospiraceae bacterium]
MDENKVKRGGISVETAHIFPIIKKWLYSEKDIFLREIVSNATDAVTKLCRLSSLGQYDSGDEKYSVKVILDKEAKTLTVSDNGIGMTEEELEKYICSIALSGALDFIQKYDENNQNNGIIGHFGLGFYSSFMVSDTVELITRSFADDKALRWVCNGAGEYEIDAAERGEHGTDVIMHISDEESAYLDENKIKDILEKYCSFMSVDIYFETEGDESDEASQDASTPINETSPLWLKNASDCTEEEYAEFYKKVFHDYREPLFHIHINADYPLNFKGVLYFPARINEYESYEGQVKLFYNQVFVADDIKEVIPDFLLMLKGVLDCPELPLNVSRSYLQDNAYIKKVSSHIVKKVADKICSLCNVDREKYEKIWKELKIFFEYASLRDKKFYDRVKSAYLLELTDGTYMTVDEYLKCCEETHKGKVYYTNDKALQAQYISMFESEGAKIAVLEHQLDVQFISMCEMNDSEIKYARIDSDVVDMLKSDEDSESNEGLVALFKDSVGNDKLEVKFEALKDESVPALITLSEESRRMEEMMKMYASMGMNMGADFPVEYTLVLNSNSHLIAKLDSVNQTDSEKAKLMALEIYRLALMSQKRMSADELKAFLTDSFKLLGML